MTPPRPDFHAAPTLHYGARAQAGNTMCLPTIASTRRFTLLLASWACLQGVIFGADEPKTIAFSPAATGTALTHLLYSVDFSLPVGTGGLSPGKPGIQVDGSGNILALNESVHGVATVHGYGEASLVAGGPGGRPVAHCSTTSVNHAYDAIKWVDPGAGGAPLVESPGQSWIVIFVMKQTGPGANGLFQVLESPGGVHVSVFGVNGAKDGVVSVEQNNDHAYGNEPASALSALGQEEVVAVVANGSDRTISVYRQGTRTYQTDSGKIGGLGKPTVFQILNNAQADVSLVEIADEGPSTAELDAEFQRLAALYGITGVSRVTEGAAVTAQPVPVDHTQSWLTYPNFPVGNDLPTEKIPILRDGLVLAPGAVSRGYQDFTPSGNVNTRAMLDAQVYYNPLTGNQTVVTGNDGIDGSNDYYAKMRRYAPGSPYDLHTFGPDGLSIGAIASQNNTAAGCTPGHIYGGMIREPTTILPGDIISVRYRLPTSVRAWTPVWLFEGGQETPGPHGSPYAGFGTTKTLLHNETNDAAYYEYDLNDGYTRHENGVPQGHQVNTDYVTEKNTTFNVAPYRTYTANGPDFTFHPHGGPDFSSTNKIDLCAGMHDLVMAWRGDGSHLVDMYIDGKKYLQEYWEYNASTYTTADGVKKQIPMHLIIGNQCIPNFLPSADKANLTPNDGIPGSWGCTVAEIKIIRGSIANDASTVTDTNATPVPPNVPGPQPTTGQHAVTFNSHGVVSTPLAANQHPGKETIKVMAIIAPTAADLTDNAQIIGMWGNSETEEWQFKLDAGHLSFLYTDGKQTSTVKTSAPAGLVADTFVTLEADVDPAAGTVTFWKTPVDGTRTQVGETLSTTPRTIVARSAARVRMGQDSTGANAFHGSISAASITINGTVVLDPVVTATTITDRTGAVWTEYGTTANQ